MTDELLAAVDKIETSCITSWLEGCSNSTVNCIVIYNISQLNIHTDC